MNKKVIKEIVYCQVSEIYEEEFDLPITLNGQCMVNAGISKADGIKMIEQIGMIKGDDVIIPIGWELTEINQINGASEYNFNNGQVLIDMVFDNDDESKYIA